MSSGSVRDLASSTLLYDSGLVGGGQAIDTGMIDISRTQFLYVYVENKAASLTRHRSSIFRRDDGSETVSVDGSFHPSGMVHLFIVVPTPYIGYRIIIIAEGTEPCRVFMRGVPK